jgi:hypothetical protein
MHYPYTKIHHEFRTTSKTLSFYRDGQVSGTPTDDIREYTYDSVFSGFKNPGWRQEVKEGRNATTIANGSKTTVTSTPTLGHFDVDAGGGHTDRYVISGNCAEIAYLDYQLALLGEVPYDKIQNAASLGFLKKCKQAQRQLSSGVVLGEIRETLHLIKNPAKAFRDLLTDYVRSCRGKAKRLSPKRHASMVANQWLEYSFGMLPLLSDIKAGYEALQRIYIKPHFAYVIHVVREPFYGYVDQKNIDLFSGYVPATLIRSVFRIGGKRISGGVKLAQKDLAKYQALGLGLDEFIPTVYELIPYSFLVDYFTNLGGVLEVCSFNRLDIVWQSSSVFTDDNEYYTIQPRRTSTFAGNEVKYYELTPGQYHRQSKSFARTALAIDVPSLAVKIPGDWHKFLNIAALASLRVL